MKEQWRNKRLAAREAGRKAVAEKRAYYLIRDFRYSDPLYSVIAEADYHGDIDRVAHVSFADGTTSTANCE